MLEESIRLTLIYEGEKPDIEVRDWTRANKPMVAVCKLINVFLSTSKKLELKTSDMFWPFNTVNGLGNLFELWFEIFQCYAITLFTHVDEAEKNVV